MPIDFTIALNKIERGIQERRKNEYIIFSPQLYKIRF